MLRWQGTHTPLKLPLKIWVWEEKECKVSEWMWQERREEMVSRLPSEQYCNQHLALELERRGDKVWRKIVWRLTSICISLENQRMKKNANLFQSVGDIHTCVKTRIREKVAKISLLATLSLNILHSHFLAPGVLSSFEIGAFNLSWGFSSLYLSHFLSPQKEKNLSSLTREWKRSQTHSSSSGEESLWWKQSHHILRLKLILQNWKRGWMQCYNNKNLFKQQNLHLHTCPRKTLKRADNSKYVLDDRSVFEKVSRRQMCRSCREKQEAHLVSMWKEWENAWQA